jgi:hypothetical protein
MPVEIEIFVPLDDAGEALADRARRALGWREGAVAAVQVLRRSLDARRGRDLGFRQYLKVFREGEPVLARAPTTRPPLAWPRGRARPRVVVVGSGPTGSWAALRLSEAGIAATIVERGKPVQPRRHDLASLQRGTLNPASNYCFGEGGAGTYSDGKLYTRSKDRDAVSAVLSDLVRFGAPEEIEIESRPHVGSNRLPRVLTGLREHLESRGVVYRFETTFAGLRLQGDRIRAVRLEGGDEIEADAVVLAVGHSARPVYAWAATAGVALEPKPFALGVRIEHPQSVINEMQYGRAAGHPNLPAAFYELKATGAGRGVYSFCMCPGGWIVPAATESDGVVVNGMSLSRRDSPFANSGLVVAVATEDFGMGGGQGPLAGIELQRRVEQAACVEGGGRFQAPAQRLGDLLNDRASLAVGATSYRPGVVPSDLRRVFPAPLFESLREGLVALAARHRHWRHPDAVVVATESRTSSPVRLLRDPRRLSSPGLPGLFPAGEGAGYAGGIVSAALDGVRVAEAVVASATS